MEINEAKLLLPDLGSSKKETWVDLGYGNGTFYYALAKNCQKKVKHLPSIQIPPKF